MDAVWQSFLAGFPVLLLHTGVTLAMLAVAVVVYVWVTPWDEIALIRGGNTAAVLSLGGAVVGLAIPLAFAMATSVGVLDILIWGAVTLVLQVIAYRVTDLILRDMPARIEAGEMGAAVLMVAIKLAVAAVNAAAVSG